MIAFLNRLYRVLFRRGGYGVHSPFAFDLLTTVIEERKLYYCYERLHTVRLQLTQYRNVLMCGQRMCTISKMLKTNGFTESEHKLLFRLANRFRPKIMLAMGSDFGLTPLYLTAYSTDSTCIVMETEPSIAAVANDYINKYATASITVCNHLDEIRDKPDFVVWGAYLPGNTLSLQTFERFLSHIHEESVMVISGINASSKNRNVWKAICGYPTVTVTVDLYRLGIVFFNPKLHRRTYKSIVF